MGIVGSTSVRLPHFQSNFKNKEGQTLLHASRWWAQRIQFCKKTNNKSNLYKYFAVGAEHEG